MLFPRRQHKVSVIRFRCAASRGLIDHEISAACLDGFLELLDGLLDASQLSRAFGPGKRNAEPAKPGRDLPGGSCNR